MVRKAGIQSAFVGLIKIHRQNLIDTFWAFFLAFAIYALGTVGMLVLVLGAGAAGGLLGVFADLLEGLGVAAVGRSFTQASELVRDGRAHAARKANEIVAYDPRPPIVYLRSFQDEEIAISGDMPFGFFWCTALFLIMILLSRGCIAR
jgi:hypothetical protein